jgi:hypothetical protein
LWIAFKICFIASGKPSSLRWFEASKPNKAAMHTGMLKALPTPLCDAKPDSYNRIMLDLLESNCLHKAVCNLLTLDGNFQIFAPLFY